MKKRLLAILLAVCLIATLMPTSALAYVGGLHYMDAVGVEAWRDDEFLYLANDYVKFMIEHDYGLGMQLWTTDEVASWGQGVQEMRFTIQYPGQEERDMNVTRLEQSWTDGVIWLTYHFGNDHYKTPGDVEITYEAQITLSQVDSGAASGYTGQYVEFDQSDAKQNWAVLIKGEFEYDSDSVVFDLGGELEQVGATARVYTTYEGFPNMGHETYQNQEAPVPVMLSSYVYDNSWREVERKRHTSTNISRGLGKTDTGYDDNGYGAITEIYTSGYAWANPFIATSYFYQKNTGYASGGMYDEDDPGGIAGYPDKNENLGVNDQSYDQRDKRGRTLNLPRYVSYSPGSTSGECVVTTVSEATMLGYKSGDGVTVYDSGMASTLYGYRNLAAASNPSPPTDRDDVNVSADADRLAIWYENGNVRVEPVLGEDAVPDNAVAVLRGTFELTDDGTGYIFLNGAAALSPTVTASWPGYEGSKWALIVYKSGAISVDGHVSLNAPTFKFYQTKVNEDGGLKLEVTTEGIKMTIDSDKNSAVPYVDIPNTSTALTSGIIKPDGGLEFQGKLQFHNFFANQPLDIERLAYGYDGTKFTIFGVEATGDIQKTELAGLELGSISGDINTFYGSNTFNFNAELDVFSLFKAQAELNFSRMDNGELMPDDIYFEVDSAVGVPITPPAPLAKLKGGGAGIYNLATTINGDWNAVPPILLRGKLNTEIINLLTGTANGTFGPSQIELEGTDIKIKALGNIKVIESVGVGVYLGGQNVSYDGKTYTGVGFNGETWLKAGLPSVSMNFIKMDNAMSLGVFGGVEGSSALLRVTGNAKSSVEIQFPDSWPVIGGWNLLGAELNAAAGAQTVTNFSGSIGDIFDDTFENLDIYLGVAATASFLGSEGRVWVLFDSDGYSWDYDYKLAGELPDWSWEGKLPFSASSANGGEEEEPTGDLTCEDFKEIEPMSDPVPVNSATATVVVSGVTGEQSGYIVLAFDDSVTESDLESMSVTKQDGTTVNLVWAEQNADGDFVNATTANAASELAARSDDGNTVERVVIIFVGTGDGANGTYTVTLPAGITAPNSTDTATASPLDKLSSSIEASTSSGVSGTIKSSVVNPEAGAKYIVRTYLGEEYGGADYLLDETVVTDDDLSTDELDFTIEVSLSGTAAPSGTYHSTIFLMREETITGDDGTEQKVLVAIDSNSTGTNFTYENTNAPSDAPDDVTLTAIGNENMTASWSAVSGADGYKIVIYDEDGKDTGLGYEYDAEQFNSASENYISGLKVEDGTYFIDMAMTVGDELEANESYIVGVSAYSSDTTTIGSDSTPIKYYGPEGQSAVAYLPEYQKLELDITYNSSYPLTANEDTGTYTLPIREANIGKTAVVEVQNAQSGADYQITVTRTDIADDEEGHTVATSASGMHAVSFTVQKFVGTLPLRIEASVKRTDNGVEVTDTTVKYLYIIYDDVAPIITLDQDVFLADENGKVSITGTTEPGATVSAVFGNAVFENVTADGQGRFTLTGVIESGCMGYVEAYDEAGNSGTDTGFVAPQPESPVTPDPDPDEPDVPVWPVFPGGSTGPDETEEPEDEGLPFIDVHEGDWFYENVEYVYENSLMNGVSETLFEPNGTVTRGMIVTILHRLEGEPESDYDMPFTDVAEQQWYAGAVRWAAGEGIVTGVSATEFAPDDPITREQFAAILWRYAQSKGYDVSASADLTGFLDYGQISEYALPALQWAVGAGVMSGRGDGILAPQGTATRAEAAAMLMRFVENVK